MLKDEALPDAVRDQRETLHRLAVAYKEINAPTGKLGMTLIGVSTAALAATNDAVYGRLENRMVA